MRRSRLNAICRNYCDIITSSARSLLWLLHQALERLPAEVNTKLAKHLRVRYLYEEDLVGALPPIDAIDLHNLACLLNSGSA